MNRNSFSWLFAAAALAACTPRANFVDNVDGSSDAVADGSAPDGVVSDTATDRVAVDGATNDGGVDVPVGPDAKVLDVPPVDDVPVGPDAKVLDVPPVDDVPITPDVPVIGDVPVTPDVPVIVDVPVTPDVPVVMDVPVVPDVPVTPDVPVIVDVPVTPDVPVIVDIPVVPDVPVRPDVPVLPDVPVIVDVPVDVPPPPVDPCPTAIDLNARGTLVGAVTRFVGNTSSQPARSTVTPACVGASGYVQMFRYTPRTTGPLVVSTANAGTPTTFDTVAWAINRCAATGATELGCDDDIGGAERRSSFTVTSVTAGVPIYVGFGGYSPPTGPTWIDRGAFEISVTELTVVGAGAACDPAVNVCVAGYTCAGTPGTCQPNAGTNGGACRTASPVCDTGLACSNAAAPRCRPAVPAGGACDVTGATNACAAPASCVGGTCRTTYSESAIAAPTWIDACATGTRATLEGTGRDDTTTAMRVTIPYTFQLFGVGYSQFWANTNGFIDFGVTSPGTAGSLGGAGALPAAARGPAIAALWQDLELRPSPTSDLCYVVAGAAPTRRFVIEWLDVNHYNVDAEHLTFEVVMYESSNIIDIIYNRLEAPTTNLGDINGANAAVGIQSAGGAAFQVRTLPIVVGQSIRFTPM